MENQYMQKSTEHLQYVTKDSRPEIEPEAHNCPSPSEI